MNSLARSELQTQTWKHVPPVPPHTKLKFEEGTSTDWKIQGTCIDQTKILNRGLAVAC